MRPWDDIPTVECGEPLAPLPPSLLRWEPHPYRALGAPYGDRSPWYLRRSVGERLVAAEARLQRQHPGWRLRVYDAYRPLAVQAVMVEHACREVAGAPWETLSSERQAAIRAAVAQFWALPDPERAPPHSTGAAVDVTLQDRHGRVVAMGGAIDEVSPRSYPDFYADHPEPTARIYHGRRLLLHEVLSAVGFVRHPQEWWHFAWGDRLWAYTVGAPAAVYGRADLLC